MMHERLSLLDAVPAAPVPPVERPPVSKETLRVTTQLEQACKYAFLEAPPQDRPVDLEEAPRKDRLSLRNEDPVRELMASAEFAACALLFQKAATEGLAAGRRESTNYPMDGDDVLLTMEGLPGADAFIKRALLVGSMPKIVELTRRWQQDPHREKGVSGSAEMPRDIEVALKEYAIAAGKACQPGSGGYPAAAAYVRGILDTATLSRVEAIGRVTNHFQKDRQHEERYSPGSPSHPLRHDPQRDRVLVKMTSELLQEARGYFHGHPFPHPDERERVASFAEQHGLTETDFFPSNAYAAGAEKVERDQKVVKRRLGEIAAQERDLEETSARKRDVQNTLYRLKSVFSEAEQAGLGHEAFINTYADRVRHLKGAESSAGSLRLTNGEAIRKAELEVEAQKVIAAKALEKYKDSLLMGKEAHRRDYLAATEKISELESKLIDFHGEATKEFLGAVDGIERTDKMARDQKEWEEIADSSEKRRREAEVRTHRSAPASRQDRLLLEWRRGFGGSEKE